MGEQLIMVAGDVVNGVNLSGSFQPAVGVSICITSLQGLGGDVNAGISDGVTSQSNAYASGTAGVDNLYLLNFLLQILFICVELAGIMSAIQVFK